MNSIRRQLSRELLGLTLLLVGGGVGALYLAARAAAIEQFDYALKTKALALSTLTLPTAAGVRVEFSDRFFHGFEDRKPRDFYELWNSDGRPLARSESLPSAIDLPPRPGTPDRPAWWNLVLPTGRAGRAIGFRFQPKARDPALRGHEPSIELVVASDRDDLDETLWELLSLAAACGVLLAAATLWVGPRVLGRGLASLRRLGEQTEAIDAGTLGTRFDEAAMPEELRPIARRLNELLGRLETSFERERRFSADLAHELRTPLAELRSLAECALKWPDSRDPGTDRETLAIAHHMERLVTHVLALARAEHGQGSVKLERVDLEGLVRRLWTGFAGRAEARALRVEFCLRPAEALADAGLLRSVLLNLLDNALEYTPSGGRIQVSVGSGAGRATLVVANDAPELAVEDVPRLFDRFWRKEEARSGGQHFGLGLSLSRSFAEVMGWNLAATLRDGIVAFTLIAPLAPLPEATADRPRVIVP